MAISLRLDSAREPKLDKHARHEGRSKSDVIRSLIEQFLRTRSRQPTPWELGKNVFGRHSSGRGDLSANRKAVLKEKLRAKKNRRSFRVAEDYCVN